jgi:membrane protein implicated in regulation of membrane protease activity
MEWWIWLSAGLLLMLAELLTPGGFYFLFFGVGACAAAAAALVTVSAIAQALVFTAVSIVSLALFRKPLLEKLQKSKGTAVDQIAGEFAIASADIAPGEIGSAELRGSTWKARNAGGVTLKSGSRCAVEKVDGLMLILRSE